MDNTTRMRKHSRLDPSESAPHTVVTIVFKDKSRRVVIPNLGEWDCRLALTGRLHRYDVEAGHVVVITPKFGTDNGILFRFEFCSKILISTHGHEWVDLVQQREQIADRLAELRADREREEREAAARRAAAEARKREREEQEAAALAERKEAARRAREREYEHLRETEVETALRQALGETTAVVALTDQERSQLKRATIAKLIGPQRAECYHRLVWPGLSVSQFALGHAPTGRPQYQVRFHPRIELRDLVLETPPRKAWIDPEVIKLDLPIRRAVWDRAWDACPDVAPPGYPDTTAYENRRRGILGQPRLPTLRRSLAGSKLAKRARQTADERSLLWQMDNARRAARRDRERREQEAQEAIARMSPKKEE